ncbi:unnamed protein product, partial [marine sediment metagenome]
LNRDSLQLNYEKEKKDTEGQAPPKGTVPF